MAVVVLAVLGEPPDPALDPRLREAVAEIARGWAAETASRDLAFFLDTEDDETIARDLSDMLIGQTDGPVLLVAPDVPRLDRALADAALGDIAAGCSLSFAPATDARPFLLALAAATPETLALVGGRDRARDDVLAAALALGGEVGLLRSERRVVTPADARALALDPLIPAALRELAALSR